MNQLLIKLMRIEELIAKLHEWALLGYTIQSPVEQIYYILTKDGQRVTTLKITNKCVEHILQAALKVQS